MEKLVRAGSLIAIAALVASCHAEITFDNHDGGHTKDLESPPDQAVCVGLACQINYTCAGGGHTTLSGKVYAPNGTLPLYNATVFVPGGTVDPIVPGVTCDRCDGKVSGMPLAAGLTHPDGGFMLTDVPTGTNIPLVIQVGRWRRQVVVPSIADCTNTEITDAGLTRLPKNKSEGDIPQIAIVTGGSDPFECLLLKIGIEPGEITSPTDATPGRVHFFTGTDQPGRDLVTPAPKGNNLYSSLTNLLRYDVVLLPCEGQPFDKSMLNGAPLDPDPRALLKQYVDAGGRLFTTHFSYDWLTYDGSPYNKIAMPALASTLWPTQQADDFGDTIAAQLITSFPKGADFAKWLKFAGAASAMNTLNIEQGRHDLTGVDPMYAQPWATYDFSAQGATPGPGIMHMTFNTPIDAVKDDMGVPAYCGRVVFSDFHVTAGALVPMSTDPFPAACAGGDMTDQEKALTFMLFDLSSCVQQDTTTPIL